MKRFIVLLLAVLTVFPLLVSCDSKEIAETESKIEIADDFDEIYGFYCRQNDNGYDSFSITLYEDGTYTYYETLISSHIGYGEYSVDDNLITLTNTHIPTVNGSASYTFKFEYRDGKLFFLAADSDQFMYVHLPDGAQFNRVETEDTKEE